MNNYYIKLLLFLIIIKNIAFYNNNKLFISNLKSQIEFIKSEKYLIKCSNKNNQLKINIKKKLVPKISIISPIHNSEKYILRFLKSIQYQSFRDREIVLIDDFSQDNTIGLISEYFNQDKRVIILKNKKNKGTFISRNVGVLYSKGKYAIFPDPDDILSKNILYLCYKYAEKYQYEFIRFNMYIGKEKLTFNSVVKNLIKKLIIQPELSSYIYYGNNELEKIDNCVSNKFIKTQVYIKALNSLDKYYLNLYITFIEDTMMNYILYKTAKSLIFIDYIGYYYIKNSQSITKNLFKISELRTKFSFIFLDIAFKYSKNTKFYKDIPNLIFTELFKELNIYPKLIGVSKDLIFYYNVIIKYINCIYITNDNKIILKNFQNIINLKKLRKDRIAISMSRFLAMNN